MADILKLAEQLNSEVNHLNNERSKLEGRLESAKTSYEKAVKAYKDKYGVELSEKNLQAEYNKVFAETKGSVLDLQEQIESIKRGDYKKEDTQVTFNLEPDVEPIRKSSQVVTVDEPTEIVQEKVEEEPKPEKKKRGRKPKIAPVVTDEPSTIEPESEIKVPDGPLNLNLDFNVEGSETVVSVGEETKAPISKKESITDNLDELLAETEMAVQNPITLGVESEYEDGLSFGSNPDDSDEVSLDGFGGFGDFGDFETEDNASDEVSLGDLGGFGSTESPVEQAEKAIVEETPVEDAIPTDLGGFGDMSDVSFGGFGGFGGSAVEEPTKTVETTKEAPTDTSDVAEDWGNLGDFDNIDFDNIMNGTDIKFGE